MGCFQHEPSARSTAKQLLEHPWLQGEGKGKGDGKRKSDNVAEATRDYVRLAKSVKEYNKGQGSFNSTPPGTGMTCPPYTPFTAAMK